MEPITLCGAIIVLFGLWVEFEAVIMKVVRALSRSTAVRGAVSSAKAQRPVVLPPNGCRGYRTGNGLSY
jgi:hypothetical protein